MDMLPDSKRGGKPMKKKILSIVLSFALVFSTTGFAFADTVLDNPQIESEKIEQEEQDSSQEKSLRIRIDKISDDIIFIKSG